MRAVWMLLLALLSACDEHAEPGRAAPGEPSSATALEEATASEAVSDELANELAEQASEPQGEATQPTSPTAPSVRVPPSRAEFESAREACSSAFTELRSGQLEEPVHAIGDALSVLRRASESPPQRRVLGACLYNQGRAMEEWLDIEMARVAYEESLEVRPNRVVAERFRRLGTREVDPSSDRVADIERQLARSDGHPCGERRGQCESKVLMYAHSGGGPLLRAAVLAMSEDDDVTTLYLAWAGERGEFQWGPRIGPREELDVDGLVIDEPMGTLAFRPVVAGEPWYLFIRYETDWTEECCGGRSEGHTRDLVVCELKGEARCVLVAERRYCEGLGMEGVDSFLPCEQDDTQRVVVGTEGLTLSGDRPENSQRFVRTGAHSWASLFPPRTVSSP